MADISLRSAFVFILAQLILFVSAAANAEDFQLKEVASFDLAPAPDGDLLVPVTIAGRPRKMVLELADAFSGINNATVTELSLDITSALDRATPACPIEGGCLG